MDNETTALKLLADWWPFGAFVAGGLVAYWSGQKRQEFTVETLMREQRVMNERLALIERAQAEDDVEKARLATTIQHINELLTEMRNDLRAIRGM